MIKRDTVIFIPDSKESRAGLDLLYKEGVKTIVIGRKSWLEERDYTNSIAVIEWDFKNELDQLRDALQRTLEIHQILPQQLFGIYAFTEGRVEIAAQLSEYFDVPGLTFSEIQKFRNKLTMREIAEMHGVKNPLFCDPSEEENRSHFFSSLKGNKCIAKPTKSWACQGVKVFESPEEAEQYFQENKINKGEWILEEFIEGEMKSIGGAIVEGNILQDVAISYGVPAIFKGTPEHPHVVFYTMEQESEEAEQLRRFHRKLVNAFKLNWALTDVEVLKEKTTGELYLCEIAARHTSHRILKLHKLASGVCPIITFVKAIAEKCINGVVESKPVPTKSITHGGLIGFLSPKGTVENATPFSEFSDQEIVFREELNTVGTHFETNSVNNLIGFLVVASNKESHCQNLIKQYSKKFRVHVAQRSCNGSIDP